MSQVSKDEVLNILSTILDPVTEQNIVEAGIVSSIVLKDRKVGFAIEPKYSNYEIYERVRKECEQKVISIAGIDEVTVVLTSHQKGDSSSNQQKSGTIRNVKHIVAVGSGKGGVGKSTIAACIALSLKNKGFKVGLADADIYGPSVPKLFNVKREPEINKEKQMIPIESLGVQTMSMGYLLPDDAATIWRGSMAIKALHQILKATAWGGDEQLDVLIIDLPPGTGDIHLTLCQQYTIDGAVIVSTPQELSLLDVQKAIGMFNKVQVPIVGLVENMSYFEGSDGSKQYIFGEPSVKKMANDFSVPFIASIPLMSNAGLSVVDHDCFDGVVSTIINIIQ